MNIKKLTNAMEKDISKEMKAISFEILARVVKKTPVKSGDAQSSWNLTENKINTDIKEKIREQISGKKDIYVTNSIDYIKKLENGWSEQASKGMVAVTINELKSL